MLARLMRSCGLNQAELALVLNIDRQGLAHWAQGKRKPRATALKLMWLIDALNTGQAPKSLLDLALWRRSVPPGPEDWAKDQSGEH